MRYLDEFRDHGLVRPLVEELHRTVDRPLRIMEVCGTHTMAIFRHGIRSLLPEEIELVSGPGCPVCVTPQGYIDTLLQLARQPDIIVATFGDMLRVPGSGGSLAGIRAEGGRVELVYSPLDALALAREEPEQQVVFVSVGFETTTPTIAATLLQAAGLGVDNFSILVGNKVMIPPLRALMNDPELHLDGLLCPGHVSVIIGADSYGFLAEEYGLACAVAGFEPTDILQGILELARQVREGKARVANCYGRAVRGSGNGRARQLVEELFMPADVAWRGLGTIPASGLELRPGFADFDALHRFGLSMARSPEPPGCRCGEVLRGICRPGDCPLFGSGCTPARPVGPCMVSSEGTCAAWFRYGDSR